MLLDGAGQVWAKDLIGANGWTPESPAGETAISAGGYGLQMLLDSHGAVWAKGSIGNGGWTQETPNGEAAIAAGGHGLQMLRDGGGQVWAENSSTSADALQSLKETGAVPTEALLPSEITSTMANVSAGLSTAGTTAPSGTPMPPPPQAADGGTGSFGFGEFAQESPAGESRIAKGGAGLQMLLDGAGQVWAKNTVGNGGWIQESPAGETQISAGADGTTQMLLDGAGQVWAKSSIGNGGWIQESPAGERTIAAGGGGLQMLLDGAGQVWAKSSIGDGGWIQESPAGERTIAAGGYGLQMLLDSNGAVWAKGSIGNGGWIQETASGDSAIAAGADGSTQMLLDASGEVWADSGGTNLQGLSDPSAEAASASNLKQTDATESSLLLDGLNPATAGGTASLASKVRRSSRVASEVVGLSDPSPVPPSASQQEPIIQTVPVYNSADWFWDYAGQINFSGGASLTNAGGGWWEWHDSGLGWATVYSAVGSPAANPGAFYSYYVWAEHPVFNSVPVFVGWGTAADADQLGSDSGWDDAVQYTAADGAAADVRATAAASRHYCKTSHAEQEYDADITGFGSWSFIYRDHLYARWCWDNGTHHAAWDNVNQEVPPPHIGTYADIAGVYAKGQNWDGPTPFTWNGYYNGGAFMKASYYMADGGPLNGVPFDLAKWTDTLAIAGTYDHGQWHRCSSSNSGLRRVGGPNTNSICAAIQNHLH